MILGPLQFDRPWWLIAAPIAILLTLWIAHRSITGLGPVAHRVAIAIRIIAILLAALALAEPSYRLKAEHVSVLVVQDLSKSMPPGIDKAFEDYLDKAVENAPLGSRMGVVTAARSARAQILPSQRSTPQSEVTEIMKKGVFDPGDTEGTDLEEAGRLALAIKPEDTAARIVLISDGNETEGSLLAFADSARTAGVPVDVLPMPYDIERELVFDTLVAPSNGRIGQTVNLRFVITSTKATKVRLGLLLNREPFDLTPGEDGTTTVADLMPGSNVITVPILLTRGGPQEYEGYLEPLTPDDDTRPQNNHAGAVTFVATEGMVLVYANDPDAAEPLVRALETSRLTVDVRHPASGHQSLVELQRYDAIILFDVSSSMFNFKQQQELAAFVNDSGGGLVMVGGPDSFGAGGWIGTPVADVLPVKLDPPEKRQIPRGALVIVVDVSGSMGMPVGSGGLTQLDVATRATIAAMNTLSRLDQFGMIAFAGETEVVVPLAPNNNPEATAQRIRRVAPQGGTDMFPAIDEAIRILAPQRGSRHIIVLSDGQTGGDENTALRTVAQANAAGITLSTVTIGDGANTPLMDALAKAGGGNNYIVNTLGSLYQLPQIFIREAQTIRRSLIWEGDPVNPTLVNSAAEPMRGISSSLPAISGYVVTAERDGLSLITVKGPNDDPIVAQWQSGLGRSIAFTSDASARWSSSWLSWGQFRAFWDQHIRWVMRPSGSANVTVSTQSQGDRTRVLVNALDTTGNALNFARFQGRTSGPDGKSEAVELRQVGPGRYEGEFNSTDSGSYLLSLRYDAPRAGENGQPGSVESGTVLAAVSRPFADEHRALKDNTALLQQIATITSGRMLDTDPVNANLFDRDGLTMPVAATPIWLPLTLAAIGIFLVDVGVRRVRIDIPAMARSVRKLFGRAKHVTPQQLEGLRAAREGARARIAEQATPASTPTAASAPAASTSNVKFDVGDAQARSTPTASPLDLPSAPPPTQINKLAAEQTSKPEEPGMSRLMQAKRRAQDRLKDSDSPE